MKKMISICVVAMTVLGIGAGCRTGASVQTKHHNYGVDVGTTHAKK